MPSFTEKQKSRVLIVVQCENFQTTLIQVKKVFSYLPYFLVLVYCWALVGHALFSFRYSIEPSLSKISKVNSLKWTLQTSRLCTLQIMHGEGLG
jgi:hypothetical protein